MCEKQTEVYNMDYRKETLAKPYPQTLDIGFVPNHWEKFPNPIKVYQKHAEGIPEPYCNYTHVFAVNDWPSGIHSIWPGGVQLIENIPEQYPNAVIMRLERMVGEAQSGLRNKIRGDMLECLDRPYDMLSLVTFPSRMVKSILNWLWFRNAPAAAEAQLFCSEFVVRPLRNRGVDIVDSVDAELVSPARLMYQPEFIYIGQANEFTGVEMKTLKYNAMTYIKGILYATM